AADRQRRRRPLPAAGDRDLQDPRRPARGPAALPRMGRRDHRRRRPHHRNPPRADAQAQPGQRRARPVPQRARRRPRPPPRRRPDLRPAHRHQPARADVPRRPAGHRHPAAGRRPRDHVNLITNGMLTLLRHPGLPARLTREPALIVTLTEELLRYDPPVHLLPNRATLADIPIADTTIPAASPLALVLAARNRDPRRFPHPHPAPGLTPGLRHLPRPPAGPPQSPGRPPRPTPPARHPPAGHRPATLPAQPGTARPPPPPRRLRHRRPGRTSGPRSLAQSFN